MELKDSIITYLGDSVYAEWNADRYDTIKIYTNNGYGPENVILLDKDVVSAFWAFITQVNDSYIDSHLNQMELTNQEEEIEKENETND